MNTQETLRCH